MHAAPSASRTTTAAAASRFASLIQEGNERFAEGSHEEARHAYTLALPLVDPRRDGSAYVGLGAALHGARRVSEAREALEAGARLNPTSPSLYENLAIVTSDLGDTAAAADAWAAALRLRPAELFSQRAAAVAFEAAGRAREARQAHAAAASLDPHNWQVHYSRVHFLLRTAFRGKKVNETRASDALEALRPLHRPPISLAARAEHGAVPLWTRESGRGLLGDAPAPLAPAALLARQAAPRELARRVGAQRGVIMYKLGPKATELTNLELSMRLLERNFNRNFRYPVVVAHDTALEKTTRVRATHEMHTRCTRDGDPTDASAVALAPSPQPTPTPKPLSKLMPKPLPKPALKPPPTLPQPLPLPLRVSTPTRQPLATLCPLIIAAKAPTAQLRVAPLLPRSQCAPGSRVRRFRPRTSLGLSHRVPAHDPMEVWSHVADGSPR